MTDQSSAIPEPEWGAFLGIDWADKKHAWSLCVPGAPRREHGEIEHSPEAIHIWITELTTRFAGRPIAVCIEQSRGALLFALSKYGNLFLYPIHPAAANDFRKAVYPSGSKSDSVDADVLLEFLLTHRDRLRPWRPDTEQTRELQFLVEDRRRMVDEKTRCLNRLTQRLKMYFPQVLCWFGSVDSVLVWRFLEQWPDLEALRKARRSTLKTFLQRDGRCSPPEIEGLWPTIRDAIPATQDAAVIASSILFVKTIVQQLQLLHEAIREYDKRIERLTETHPDFPLVDSFPGVGKALAPRLIAALGTQRERFRNANELQSYSGIAPVQESSGKQHWTHARRACPKFVRQTFQEWAQHSVTRCERAHAYYDQHRARGKQHQAIIRSLAFKWIRILYRCWQNHTLYQEAAYSARLARRQSPAAVRNVEIVWKKTAGFSKIAAINT
jgi:transposase